MDGPTRTINEADVIGDQTEYRGLVGTESAWGVCGWDGDKTQADVVIKGDGTDAVTGRSLVKVTLFEGRDRTKRPVAGQAQGQKIKCQLLWPLTVVPPLGMQVVLLCVGGKRGTPGCWVILGGVAAASVDQFDGDRGRLDVGPDIFLTIAAKGVTTKDHGEAESPSRFPSFQTIGRSPAGGDPGIVCNDPTGSGFTIAKGVVGLYATDAGSPPAMKAALELAGSSADNPGCSLMYNGAVILTWDDEGNASFGASKSLALVSAQVLIGAGATPMTPAIWGPSGIAGVPSTSVFISK